MKLHRIFSLLFVILSLTFFISTGFAAHTPTHGPMGEMKDDAKAKKAFEEGKMLPDYTYYYLGGSIIEPDSVIALKKGFTLRDNKIWSKVLDMEDSVIRTWIQAWKNDGHSLSDFHGGVIVTSDGKEAGIWYSHFPGSVIMEPIPGVLDVYQPRPFPGRRPGQGA
jgi:hypothetical protein